MDQVYNNYEKVIRKHIMEHMDSTLKKPNSYLKYPFIDPGSVYDGNLWDWDSFWAVYALLNLADSMDIKDSPAAAKKEQILQHAKGNIHNFFDNQLEDGYIPMMIEKTNLPEPYLNLKHKEGVVMNMHKPFLCQQICLIGGYCGDYSWVAEYFTKLELYFTCYDKYYYNNNCGLYVWADDIMIGMDNDPATFGRPRYSTANIFLNAFMVAEFKAASEIALQLGKTEQASYYRSKAEKLTSSIQEECWDPRDKFFYSVDVDIKTRKFDWFHVGLGVFWKTLPIKIRAWSGFIPLWSGVATAEQAGFLLQHILDTNTFSSPYGVTSLAKDEKMFSVEATNNPSNWLGPIWLVVNYVVFRGLMNYGYKAEAEELCKKTLLLLGRDQERAGTIHEFYNPETGEPVMNGGFLNWNLLALNMVDELKGKLPMSSYLKLMHEGSV